MLCTWSEWSNNNPSTLIINLGLVHCSEAALAHPYSRRPTWVVLSTLVLSFNKDLSFPSLAQIAQLITMHSASFTSLLNLNSTGTDQAGWQE